MNTRYEFKYWLSLDQYMDIKQRVQFAFQRDSFSQQGPYPVLSRYFDTSDLYFYRQKIDGQLFHIKIRLRQYSEEWDISLPFFCEAKMKYDDHQRKIRKKIETGSERFIKSDAFQDFYLPLTYGKEVIETTKVLYWREAYQNFDRSLRITFDHDICTPPQSPVELKNFVLMEVKTQSPEIPKIIWKWLRSRKVKMSRFSKYTDSFNRRFSREVF